MSLNVPVFPSYTRLLIISYSYSGSAIGLGVNVGPLFSQLGIWDEFVAAGKEMKTMKFFDEELKPLYCLEYEFIESV